jgi:hypothetical protein
VNYIYLIRALPALLVAAFTVSIGSGAPVPAHAASEITNQAARQANDENIKKIRQANDLRQKAQEPLFPRQAKSLAKGYKETAEIVARQGGNPKPILDAAAYFESQPELISRVNPNNKSPVR